MRRHSRKRIYLTASPARINSQASSLINSLADISIRTINTLSLAGVLFIASLGNASAASSEWLWHRTSDGRHPNGQEQQRLWLLNRARTNPAAEGRWLATTRIRDIREPREFFGVDTAKLQREFATIAPAPPSAFDVRLYRAAVDHARDLIARDSQDHTGQLQAIGRHDFRYTRYRGNVYAYAKNSLYAHAGLNIDWGVGTADGMQRTRGHRLGIMGIDSPYPNVGIAVLSERNDNTLVGPYVHVDNFAEAAADRQSTFNAFIVGTVWQDTNDNGRYESGEGIPNVVVTPNRGDYYAVTASGGGYAIPISQTGDARVTFSGPGIADHTVTTRLGQQSVLVDYVATESTSASESPARPNTTTNTVSDSANVWLDRNRRISKTYGHRAGGISARERVLAQFWGQGDDLRLTLRGYDIDEFGEVTVTLNGQFVANLRRGANNQFNGGDVILLAKELQRQNGNNDVLIMQSKPGWRWGIADLLLSPLQPGAELALRRGQLNGAPRGYRYGADQHKGAVVATFDGDGTNLQFSVAGYDIDVTNEAVVFLNGRRIGGLRRGPNNALNTGNTFALKTALQKPGTNRLVIVQRRPGNRWGVRNLLLQ